MKKCLIFTLFLLCFRLPSEAASIQLKAKDLFRGQNVKIEAGLKRPMVVVFMSARCPCSASHEPLLKTLAEEFKDFDFVAVHANADEAQAETVSHFQKTDFAFPVVEDTDGQWAEQFKALKTPHAFIVNSEAQIVFSGGITDSSDATKAQNHFLKDALNEFRKNKKIKQSQKRALGCYIKKRTTL